jgi:hypothetical protein
LDIVSSYQRFTGVNVKGSTSEHMIVGNCIGRVPIFEEVVGSTTEVSDEGVAVKTEKIHFSLMKLDIRRTQNDLALTCLCANEVALLEGIRQVGFVKVRLGP